MLGNKMNKKKSNRQQMNMEYVHVFSVFAIPQMYHDVSSKQL